MVLETGEGTGTVDSSIRLKEFNAFKILDNTPYLTCNERCSELLKEECERRDKYQRLPMYQE